MNFCKSIVKSMLLIAFFLSPCLFASQVLITDVKKTDYRTIESHLNYGFHSNDSISYPLEIKATTKKEFEKILPPLYNNQGVLFQFSTKGLKKEVENKMIDEAIYLAEKETLEIKSDSIISFVMKVTF